MARTVGWLVAVVALWAAGAAQAAEDSSLYVVRRGWHIDIGVPTAELAAALEPIAHQLPGSRYVFFGFGDRRYLQAKHPHGPVMLAALWPGRALILTTGLSDTPTAAFGAAHVARLRVSAAQSIAAQAFIRRALGDGRPGAASGGGTADASGPFPVSVARGPYAGSVYFSSWQTYSALHTCNTWGAEVLKSAGLPVRAGGVVFAGQLWRQAARLAAAE